MKLRIDGNSHICHLKSSLNSRELAKHLFYKTQCREIRTIPNHLLFQDTPGVSLSASCHPWTRPRPTHCTCHRRTQISSLQPLHLGRLGRVLCNYFISTERMLPCLLVSLWPEKFLWVNGSRQTWATGLCNASSYSLFYSMLQ